MKAIHGAAAAAIVLALGGCSAGQRKADAHQAKTGEAARPSDAASEAYMRAAEDDWAALAARPVPGLLERILADDYVGVSSTGEVRSKAKQIAEEAAGPNGQWSATKLDYVHYRHFGDTVIAQGGETLTRKDGQPGKSLVWTDVWMWRGGQWQVVASQDSVLPAKG